MIGKKAPEWTSTAYIKGDQKSLSSKDFAGQWYVLYFYPLDFTFVCPTEIVGFQKLAGDFADDKVAVIGASTDSFYSHDAWFKDRSIFAEEITHPVLADTNHSVARAFGVLKEDAGVAYRATIVVDKEGIIRSYNVNDLSVGRSPAETLRTVQAFQAGGLCGADWKKGEKFVA
ncbi:MAG: peroxiredoxin [Deltaproteobacteria bacterium]|nr:peroxiredoxin [Deltaproteobacteria bacterium]